MNIVVLAGGLSPERNVSLVSGALIASALCSSGHRVLLLDVYFGAIIPETGIDSMFCDTVEKPEAIGEREPDLNEVKRRNGGREELIGKNVLEICRYADAVFLALHGAMGENGQLQATLDNYGIKHYTGSGFAGSLLAMDKDVSKRLFRFASVPTADWITTPNDEGAADRILAAIALPCVIKPLACGSSVGVSIVNTREELDAALKLSGVYEARVLAERKITGREFSVGILGGQVLPPIEIVPLSGFYDYKNKYQPGMTRDICPAELTPEQTERVSALTRAAFAALGLYGYSRFDFILSEEDGEFYCLEANTLPGMTPVSLLPQEAAAVGIGYPELCERIIRLALDKG